MAASVPSTTDATATAVIVVRAIELRALDDLARLRELQALSDAA